jgi:hypothetical protein
MFDHETAKRSHRIAFASDFGAFSGREFKVVRTLQTRVDPVAM